MADETGISADTFAPAGISWEQAMTNAAEFLRKMQKPAKLAPPDILCAEAQAWIAYAREITLHARAVQQG